MSHIPSISPTRTTPTDRRRGLDRDHNISVRALLEVDVASLLAARFRIAPETARAHVDAFGFGGSR